MHMLDTGIAPFVPDGHFWKELFSSIDSADPAAFVNRLTPAAEFRFANAAALVGRQAIAAAVAEFFKVVASSQHRLLESWSAHNTVGCEGEVTYVHHNGTLITRGDKICS